MAIGKSALIRLVLAASLFATGAALANERPVKVGVILGLTGSTIAYSTTLRQAIEMATAEHNATSTRKIQLDVVDDASNPAQSVSAMQRLVSNNVDVIVGGFGSSQVLANMEVAERAGIPYIVVGASNPRVTTERNKWTFRLQAHDAMQAADLAQVSIDILKLTRIAIMSDTNDYGVGAKEAFTAALARYGTQPVEVQSFQTSDKDFTAQLTRILHKQPDGLAIFGTIPAAPAIMNQARELGITARFLGTGGLTSETLMTLAKEASQGTVASSSFSPEMDETARDWATRYIEMYKNATQPPRPVAASLGYFAMKLLVSPCVLKVGTDKVAVRQCIRDWRGPWPGAPKAEGGAYFDNTQQLQIRSVPIEVAGDGFVVLKDIK